MEKLRAELNDLIGSVLQAKDVKRLIAMIEELLNEKRNRV